MCRDGQDSTCSGLSTRAGYAGDTWARQYAHAPATTDARTRTTQTPPPPPTPHDAAPPSPTPRASTPWTPRDLARAARPAREPVDRRDRFLTLLQVYDLHTAPLERRRRRAPATSTPPPSRTLKHGSSSRGSRSSSRPGRTAGAARRGRRPERVVSAMRAVAAKDRLPAAYRWLAKEASWDELVEFLALEGGPDGGFDDLVALCQLGPVGQRQARARQELLGRDGPRRRRRRPHRAARGHGPRRSACRASRASDLPVEALERAALGGLLATNRWLQPEMLGALGLLELQAGPRCRLVLQGFDRLGAPAAAYPFYVEHAEVDPVHGKRLDGQGGRPDRGRAPGLGPAHRQGRLVAVRRPTCASSRPCGSSSPRSAPPPDPAAGATARRGSGRA